MFFYQLEDLSVRNCPFGTILYSEKDLQNATAVLLTRSCCSFLCLYMKEGLRGDCFLIATEEEEFNPYVLRYFEVAGAPILDYELKSLSFNDWVYRLNKNNLLKDSFVLDSLQQMALLPMIDLTKHAPIVDDFCFTVKSKETSPDFYQDNVDNSKEENDDYYLIYDNDSQKRKELMLSLVEKLYQEGRMQTNRVTYFSLGKLIKEGGYGIDKLVNIYKTNYDGAVVIGVPNLAACKEQPWWKVFFQQVTRHQKKVTTIFYTDGRTLIDERLTTLFLPSQLQVIKDGDMPEEEIKKEIPKVPHQAYRQLQEMIGLKEVKEILDGFINYQKLAKIRKERGLNQEVPAKHMVFMGNPGTAKTTVARLIGQILKDEGILEVGDFFEVGRGDLIGQYVGHTAPIIQGKFKKAKGSVLFIDEAYSLVDGTNRSFSDEAISTIVAEMENNREDVMVIFAGYPKEMEEFIHQNPGLKSRLPYEINFPDYSFDELFEIGKLEAKKRGYELPEAAKEVMMNHLKEEKQADPNHFGNGRNVRNLVEKGMIALANRLAKKDFLSVTNEELTIFIPEDFNQSKKKTIPSTERKIGFFNE